jgi:hypothetical protein
LRSYITVHHFTSDLIMANPYWQGFMRAIGLRPGFRRTGASSLGSIAMAAAVGVISGQYIFKIPLEEYWTEENARQAELAAAAAGAGGATADGGGGGGGPSIGSTAAPATTTDSKSS